MGDVAKTYIPEFKELDPKKHGLRHRSPGWNEPLIPLDSREARSVAAAVAAARKTRQPANTARAHCDPLPGGRECDDIILRRCREPIDREALWRGIFDQYQTRGGSRERVEKAINRMIEESKLSETDGKLSLKEQARVANAPIREAILEAILDAPGIHGKQLLAAVRERCPEVAERRLTGIISGLARDGTIREASTGGWEITASVAAPESTSMVSGVGSEEHPTYSVGDDDDGEIPDPPFEPRDDPSEGDWVSRVFTPLPQDEAEALRETIGGASEEDCRPGSDLPPAEWIVFCGNSWTAADTEEYARRIAEVRAYPDKPAAIYRRAAICRVSVEWDDG